MSGTLWVLGVVAALCASVMGSGKDCQPNMPGYDIWSGEIRLWWSRPKRERPRCGARCRDGSPCQAPPVWNKSLDRPVNGRCRIHGGLSTGPKTEEGRRRIAESNRSRRAMDTRSGEKRGKGEGVTQQGVSLEPVGAPRARRSLLLLSRGVHPKFVQELLGHSSIAVTLDRYSHWIPSMGDQTARAMEAALS
jgi:hypothetical protein